MWVNCIVINKLRQFTLMFISPQSILAVLGYYKYWIIFPVAIFEGPIIIIISGFLASLGVLNIFVAYTILVLGDSIGDSIYYCLGRYGSRFIFVRKLLGFLGYNEKSEKFLENHFRQHKIKTFLIAKLSHGMGWSAQVASGIAGVRYPEFILLSLIGTIPKTLFLFLIGFYLGSSYIKINGYLNHIALFTISFALLLALYFVSKKYVKKFMSGGLEDTDLK